MKRSHLAILAAAAAGLPVHADTIGATFGPFYSLTTITRPAGLAGGYGTGGLVFDAANPNQLLVGEYADYSYGEVVSSAVTRDGSNNITGFTGSLTTLTTAPYIDAGLVYGPGQDLYFTEDSGDKVGEVASGASSPSYTVSTGVASSPGGLAFVPAGFAGAGRAAISSYSGDSICSAPVTLAGNGSYTFGACTDTVTLGGSAAESILYVPAGAPGFSANSILVANYSPSDSIGSIEAYQTDANGMPILSTATTFVSGIAYAYGMALDPVSGDILVSSYNSNTWDLIIPGAPEPGSMALAFAGLLGLVLASARIRR